jgi:hypothetical protein
MKPNNKGLLEAAYESGNPLEDPQEEKEKNELSTSGMIIPRRGERAKNTHSRWKEYVKH